MKCLSQHRLDFLTRKSRGSSSAVGLRAELSTVEMSNRVLLLRIAILADCVLEGIIGMISTIRKVHFHCSFLWRSGYPKATAIK